MPDPQIAQAVKVTIDSVAEACEEMKKQVATMTDGDHRTGMLQGIDVCIDAIKRLDAEVEEVSKDIAGFWLLSSPQHGILLVSAGSEDVARSYAATHTGAPWDDPNTSTCRPLASDPPGYVLVIAPPSASPK